MVVSLEIDVVSFATLIKVETPTSGNFELLHEMQRRCQFWVPFSDFLYYFMFIPPVFEDPAEQVRSRAEAATKIWGFFVGEINRERKSFEPCR